MNHEILVKVPGYSEIMAWPINIAPIKLGSKRSGISFMETMTSHIHGHDEQFTHIGGVTILWKIL